MAVKTSKFNILPRNRINMKFSSMPGRSIIIEIFFELCKLNCKLRKYPSALLSSNVDFFNQFLSNSMRGKDKKNLGRELNKFLGRVWRDKGEKWTVDVGGCAGGKKLDARRARDAAGETARTRNS